MSNKILYLQENGTIAIINPSKDFSIEDAALQVPQGASYRIVSNNQLPFDEDLVDFADALLVNFDSNLDPNIHFDIEKAREITKTRLRKERIEYFEQNDILLRDAIIENNSENLNIAIIERNRLRDITMTVDVVDTIDQLRQISVKK
jgi:hypothetical protein